MIDLRSLDGIYGLASADIDARAQEATRFIWRRLCEHCLSGSVGRRDGTDYCGGCGRVAMLSPLEDQMPVVADAAPHT